LLFYPALYTYCHFRRVLWQYPPFTCH
jgi:hypothetical protein